MICRLAKTHIVMIRPPTTLNVIFTNFIDCLPLRLEQRRIWLL